LHDALRGARQYTNAWLDDLIDALWSVPYLPTINPPLWEFGHVAWFQERWCLRDRGRGAPLAPSRLAHADRWYDSSRVEHRSRWSLDLPDRAATRRYADQVLHDVLRALEAAREDDDALYFFRLALHHEDMHAEAFAYLRQTLAYPAPVTLPAMPLLPQYGDVALAGGSFAQGAPRGAGFVFDNEKWSHEVLVAPFAIASRAVSETEFEAFVNDGGYAQPRWWSESGRAWLGSSGATHPHTWRQDGSTWQRRSFDRWLPLAADAPCVHVNAFEAEAYCVWAQRRLPTEAEWEFAAVEGAIVPCGVWEWTSTAFAPYPGFAPDPYEDYSAPWFYTHRVLRGASRVTPPRLWHPRFRNYYVPERGDVFVGFRTCALP
jgi:ergothioneine biosynthesis protein EgtB